MADKLAHKEKAKYSKMWGFDSYRERSPGLRFLDDALSRLQMPPKSTVVDLGCGTGRVSQALSKKGFEVTAVDIAKNACKEFQGPFVEACLWELPDDLGFFDFGFCADVMEHIPTERVDACIKSISKHVGTCYFQIANFECHEGDKIGEHLHLTVESDSWWREALKKHFKEVLVIPKAKHHIAICKS